MKEAHPPLRRKLIADAVTEAAARLEAGVAPDKRREERLRVALAEALRRRPEVAEVRTSPEWRPEMQWWPWQEGGKKKVGGFDVAMRFNDDRSYSTVVEVKWTHYGYINALDEAIWDAFKLAHATATLPGVDHALLVYLAPAKAWAKPARFANFFDDAFIVTPELLKEHEKIWRWCLHEGSASWPAKLPPALQTGPVARVPLLVNGEPWEIRAATVASNGTPWIDVDSAAMPLPATAPTVFDWPHPAPGPGMEPDDPVDEFRWPSYEFSETPTAELRVADVPGADATWSEIEWFAAHFDGYGRYGNEILGKMANGSVAYWKAHHRIDPRLSLDDLRGCLFFEYRRYRHFGHAPDTDDTPYIRGLVKAIRVRIRDMDLVSDDKRRLQ